MDEPEEFSIGGRVIWVTPMGAQSAMREGIGVQFMSENSKHVRQTIEAILGAMIQGEKRTDTM